MLDPTQRRLPAWIALGSNLGDRDATLRSALASLGALPGTRLIRTSSFHETDAIGPGVQGPYLNAAAEIQTMLSPRDLLTSMLEIERAHGRERARDERWSARTLDLDLLFYDTLQIDEPGLSVPHPRLHARRFVLAPLAEIAPQLIHPAIGRTITDLLDGLRSECHEGNSCLYDVMTDGTVRLARVGRG